MSYRIPALAVLLWHIFVMPAISEELIPAEGVVVAIQRVKGDTRIIDPPSFADLAEVYMVRVDRWSQPRKEKYIIIEYIHHADLISYDQFEKTLWKFEIHEASPDESKDCLSWMARGPSFLSTAFGAKVKLPDPNTLACFLMRKRPIPLRSIPAAR